MLQCPRRSERDTETGNDNFGARYYRSALGRWMSADWSSVPVPVPYANLTNPQTLNLYAMVSDNPETFADLEGHLIPGGPYNLETGDISGTGQGPNCDYMGGNCSKQKNANTNVNGHDQDPVHNQTITLTVQRTTQTSHSTVGTFTLSSSTPGSGTVTGYTLESPAHPDPTGNGTTRIHAGTYGAIELRPSQSRVHAVLRLSVPGHTGIEVHPGNSARDTRGCILPGNREDANFVGNSRSAVNSIRSYINKVTAINSAAGATTRIIVVIKNPAQ